MKVAQFVYLRESKYDARSRLRKMSNTMFVHKVVEACRNLQHERELMDGTMGSMYVRNAIALVRRSNTCTKQVCKKKKVFGLRKQWMQPESMLKASQKPTNPLCGRCLTLRDRQPKQIGALTSIFCCDQCLSFPPSACTCYLCIGVSNKCVARRQQLVLRQV